MTERLPVLLAGAAVIGLTAPAWSQLFEDDFNTDTSAGYRVLQFTPENDDVEFAFDYSALGIPEAPNSTGGGTTGVRMRANNPVSGEGNTSAVQIVPMGLGRAIIGLDYRVTFDLWMNANGPLPTGGTGSTEAFMAGVGFMAPGMMAIEIGTLSGTYFTVTGEGGVPTDVRSFTNDGFNAPGINVGPSDDTSDPYFAGIFPGGVGVGALPVQGGTDNQTGTTVQGQMAFDWHEVQIDKMGDRVDFFVDGLLIASDPEADTSGNVMLGYGDYFSSVSDAPQWSFGLFDNFRVVEIPAIDGDFNDDGEYDCLDVDPLVADIAADNDTPDFDLTGNGLVDTDDLTAWLAEAGAANLDSGNSYLEGDANLDGVVDVSDFNIWNSNKFTDAAAWCLGDFTADGFIDVSDFNVWNGQKFNSAEDVGAVPEPAAGSLLWLLAGGVLLANRRPGPSFLRADRALHVTASV